MTQLQNLTLEQLNQYIKEAIETHVNLRTYVTEQNVFPKLIIEIKWDNEVISTTLP